MDRMTSALMEAVRNAFENGMTQAELAQQAGIQQTSISKFMNGKTGLSSDSFARLAIFLGGELTFPGGITTKQTDSTLAVEKENARLAALLAAEKEKSELLESLLRDAMSGIRRAETQPPVPAHEERRVG